MLVSITYTKLLKKSYRIISLKRKIRLNDNVPGAIYTLAKRLALKYFGATEIFSDGLYDPKRRKYSILVGNRVAHIYITKE